RQASPAGLNVALILTGELRSSLAAGGQRCLCGAIHPASTQMSLRSSLAVCGERCWLRRLRGPPSGAVAILAGRGRPALPNSPGLFVSTVHALRSSPAADGRRYRLYPLVFQSEIRLRSRSPRTAGAAAAR